MENTINMNNVYFDLLFDASQLKEPVNDYEVAAAIMNVIEHMNDLLDDSRYAEHARTILLCVKKQSKGEVGITFLGTQVGMLTELIGRNEGIIPSPTMTSEYLRKVQERARTVRAQVSTAIPESAIKRMQEKAKAACERTAENITESVVKQMQDRAKEAYARVTTTVPEDFPQKLKEGATEAYDQVSAVIPNEAKEKGRQLMGGVRDFIKNHLIEGDGYDEGDK